MGHILTETLALIRADVQVVKGGIQVMKDDIWDIKRVQGQVWRLAARVSNVSSLILPLMTHSKNHSLSAGAGDDTRFEVVPFTNGQDPTKEPLNSFVGSCPFVNGTTSTLTSSPAPADKL
jgi:hypothetical protein